MAEQQYDGSIRISASIDTSGIHKDLKEIGRAAADGIPKVELELDTGKAQAALKEVNAMAGKFSASVAEAADSVGEATGKLAAGSMKAIADDAKSALTALTEQPVDIDITLAEHSLNKLGEVAEEMASTTMSALPVNVDIDPATHRLGELADYAESVMKDVASGFDSVMDSVRESIAAPDSGSGRTLRIHRMDSDGNEITETVNMDTDQANQKLDDLQEHAENVAENISRVMLDSGHVMTIHRMAESSEAFDSLPSELPFDREAYKKYQVRVGAEVSEHMQKVSESTGEAAERVETLKMRLDEVKATLKEMEGKGVYFGDAEYDSQYQLLLELGKEVSRIKKDLSGELEADAFQKIREGAEIADEKVVELREELEKLMARQSELSKAGVGVGYAEYDANAQRIAQINDEIKSYASSLLATDGDTQSFASGASSAFSRIAASASMNLAGRVTSILRQMVSYGASAMRSLAGVIESYLSKSISKLTKHFSAFTKQHKKGLGITLKQLMRYGLGIRSTYALINKLRRAVIDGYKKLALFSNETNQSISILKTSLERFKNSFAAATAPLFNTLAPYLVKFIDSLADAITRLGALFAALLGKTSYIQALAVQQDYAESLRNTGDAADSAKKKLQGYLSPLDEISRYEADDTKENQYFQNVPIGDMFSDILAAIRAHDWEGLGKILAGKINAALQHVYDAISWDKVGPKITAFADAFTRTFNSLVSNVDWDLLGRTVGAGINTVVRSFTLFIDGIDWKALGTGLAGALNGLVTEVDWGALGHLLGSKFMVAWNIFSGFVSNVHFPDLGVAIGEFANSLFDAIDFVEIGSALANAVNGAFTALRNFIETFNWKKHSDALLDGIEGFIRTVDWPAAARTLSTGLNEIIHETDFKRAGELLNESIKNLLNAFWIGAQETDWESLGRNVGNFIKQIDWPKHLKTCIDIIAEVFGGLLEGIAGALFGDFGENFASGFVDGIKAIIALDAAVIDAVARALQFLGDAINMLPPEVVEALGRALGVFLAIEVTVGLGAKLMGIAQGILAVSSATAGGAAAANIAGVAGAFSKLALGVGAAYAAFEATTVETSANDMLMGADSAPARFAQIIDTLGASAEYTQGQMDTLLSSMDKVAAAETSSEAIEAMAESLRDAGVKADDFGRICADLNTNDDLTPVKVRLRDIQEQAAATRDEAEVSAERVAAAVGTVKSPLEDVGTAAEESGGKVGGIDDVLGSLLKSTSWSDSFKLAVIISALSTMSETSDDADGKISSLVGEIGNLSAEVPGYKDNFESISTSLENAGIDAGLFCSAVIGAIKDMGAEIPTDLAAVSKAIDTESTASSKAAKGMGTGISEGVGKGITGAKGEVEKATQGLVDDGFIGPIQEKLDMHSPSKVAEDFGANFDAGLANGVSRDAHTVASQVQSLADGMVTALSGLPDAFGNIATRCMDALSNGILSGVSMLSSALNSVGMSFNSTAAYFNGFISKLNSLIDGAQYAQNTIADLLSFDITLPDAVSQYTGWNHAWLSIPHKASSYRIPYLATGAVIPPNAPFAAILGDQSRGTNIEAPMDTIKQGVREVLEEMNYTAGGNQANPIHLTAKASGRTIFDIVIDEGKNYVMQTGKNPFTSITPGMA